MDGTTSNITLANFNSVCGHICVTRLQWVNLLPPYTLGIRLTNAKWYRMLRHNEKQFFIAWSHKVSSWASYGMFLSERFDRKTKIWPVWQKAYFQTHLCQWKCLTHCGRDKMAAVSQTTLSKAFSWMKILEFRLRFHWSLFLRSNSTQLNSTQNVFIVTIK